MARKSNPPKKIVVVWNTPDGSFRVEAALPAYINDLPNEVYLDYLTPQQTFDKEASMKKLKKETSSLEKFLRELEASE